MMPDCFSRPTYILFDLPQAVTRQVNRIREKFDPCRAGLNAEVSITGSSGVGTLEPGQSPRKVFSEVQRIAGQLSAFQTGFRAVDSFPETGIYFFVMTDEEIFLRVHKLFCEADIQYRTSPHRYLPHCTLTLFDEPLPAETARKIMALPVPAGRFKVDNISVYSIDEQGLNPELLYRVELKTITRSNVRNGVYEEKRSEYNEHQ